MFVDTPWPEFDRRHLWAACASYAQRNRRFGAAGPVWWHRRTVLDLGHPFPRRRRRFRGARPGRLTRCRRVPGFVRGTLGRSTDDDGEWVLLTEWENVGSYRRALGNYDVKLRATPLLGEALDLPSSFESLAEVSAGGDTVVHASDREPGYDNRRGRCRVLTRWPAAPDTPRRSWLRWLRLALMLCWCAGLITEIVDQRRSVQSAADPALAAQRRCDVEHRQAPPLGGCARFPSAHRDPRCVVVSARLRRQPRDAHLVASAARRSRSGSSSATCRRCGCRSISKSATPQWWEVPVALTYLSFFIVPGATAAVLWLRTRRDFYRWSTRYVVLSFSSYRRVRARADGAAVGRRAVHRAAGRRPSRARRTAWPPVSSSTAGGLLGLAAHPQPGALPWVQRISVRCVERDPSERGQDLGQQCVATCSTRSRRCRRCTRRRRCCSPSSCGSACAGRSRPLLVLYPLMMGFTLVYAGDHYVIDVLARMGLCRARGVRGHARRAALVHIRREPAAAEVVMIRTLIGGRGG